jgi:hypothetical protein
MDAPSLTDFRHEPLPDSQSYIRLLEIIHGLPNEQIVCRLTAWPIRSAPTYCALSYAWGNPASTVDIVVNGSRMTVRSNCEYALRQAHTSATNKYIWQDAICIDQSATQEKNHQVAMMGPIYEMAAHVLACLGPHAGDSEFLTEFIDKDRSLMRHIYSRSDKSLVSGESGWSLPNPIPENRRLSVRCFFAREARTRERLVQSFITFMGRPYFSRVWVLQEM